jgi:hypothetical protein
MKTIVGVYESHDSAVKAVQALQTAGYPVKQVSLISKAELVNNHIHVKSSNTVETAEVSAGVAAGAVIGILTGVGIFAIPGLGFLFGAGALVGAFAGLDLGLIGGGLLAILTNIGIDKSVAAKYEKHLNEGKFLVFVQGGEDQSEVKRAHEILHTLNLQLELDTH